MSKKITIAAAVVLALVIGGCGYKKTPAPDNQFTDTRDGKVYRTVKIGEQTWMAENLNYAGTSGDTVGECYDNADSNCVKYGRLYTWNAAMTACPAGWRLPSDADWGELVNAVGSSAGTMLKSMSGWNSGGNGTDDFGFSALPGGVRYSDGGFNTAGYSGYWWSATDEDVATIAWYRSMGFNYDNVFRFYWDKTGAMSVRCVRD